MQIRSVFTPIKKCMNIVRTAFSRDTKPVAQDLVASGAEAMDSQGRAMVEMAKNQIVPERTDFRSTKEMFGYSKGKIIPALEGENPYEYTVVANVKDNKVLAEYKGDDHKCTLDNLESMLSEDQNVVLIHGHPGSYPISPTDVTTLLRYNIGQIIAIDKNGQFSMVAKRADVPSAKVKSKAYKSFDKDCLDDYDMYYSIRSDQLLKHSTHDTLKKNADNLGIRYCTNYEYLKHGFFAKCRSGKV